MWEQLGFFQELAARDGGTQAAYRALAGMATPLGRYARAEEVAVQIGFLLSDAAATITGAVLTADGGYSL